MLEMPVDLNRVFLLRYKIIDLLSAHCHKDKPGHSLE